MHRTALTGLHARLRTLLERADRGELDAVWQHDLVTVRAEVDDLLLTLYSAAARGELVLLERDAWVTAIEHIREQLRSVRRPVSPHRAQARLRAAIDALPVLRVPFAGA